MGDSPTAPNYASPRSHANAARRAAYKWVMWVPGPEAVDLTSTRTDMPEQRLGATYSAEAAGTALPQPQTPKHLARRRNGKPRRLVARVRTSAGTLIQTTPVAKLAISAFGAVDSDFLVAFVFHHRNEICTPAERLFDRRRLCGAFLAVQHWPPHSSIRERGNGSRSYGRSRLPMGLWLRGCEAQGAFRPNGVSSVRGSTSGAGCMHTRAPLLPSSPGHTGRTQQGGVHMEHVTSRPTTVVSRRPSGRPGRR